MSHNIKIGGLSLARDNTKLGRVLNISLPPPKSCDTSMPCFKKGCYAMKHCYTIYPNTRAAWDGNLEVWRVKGYIPYFSAIHSAIEKVRPDLFRWHVGGDIPAGHSAEGEAYVSGMVATAHRFPNTKFLVFTKRYDLIRLNARRIRACKNLNVVLSMWPGVKLSELTRKAWPLVWMRTKKDPDPRIPADAKECEGRCDKCQACWNMKAGESAVIDYH